MTSTIIDLVLGLPGKATILLSLALAAVWLARRERASLRHLMLTVTFAALAVLPAGVASLPRVGVAVPVASPKRAIAPSTTAARPATSAVTEAATGSGARRQLPSAGSILFAVWMTGAIVMLLALGRDLWRLRRMRRHGLPALDLRGLVQRAAAEAGIERPIEVSLHEAIQAPVTAGAWRTAILLPLDAREWSNEDLRRAIVHELEHVRRSDWALHVAARIVCACYWFHPLVWVAWRKLCLEAELACDDAVVRSAAHPEYAEQLVSLAARLSRQPQAALGMAKRSDLSARITAILDGGRPRGRAGLAATLVAAAGALAVVAAIAPVRAVAQVSTGSRAARALNRALLEAAEEGDLDAMTELLNAGARANAAIGGDGSPLIAAARHGRLEAVRLLLDRGADVNMGVPGDGNPLIMAAGSGHLEVVEFLLNRQANIDQVVPGDENALIQASAGGHLDVVHLLVTRGANVNTRVWVDESSQRSGGGEWRTPLNMARKKGHTDVVEYLQSKGARD